MRVYLVNKGCHDYSQAERFGELVALSDYSMDRFDLSKIWRKYEPILRESEPGDYILPSGLTVMTVVACSIFVSIHGRLNLLLFKGQKGKKGGAYVEETLILGEPNDRAKVHTTASGRDRLHSSIAKKGRES
jgi:hypothetical protein